MNCRQVERLLSDQIEGLVSQQQAERIAAHLRDCAACRRLRDEIAAAGVDLRAAIEWPRSAEIDRRALDSWLAERDAGRRSRVAGFPRAAIHSPAGRAVALGACAAVLLLAGLAPRLLLGREEAPVGQNRQGGAGIARVEAEGLVARRLALPGRSGAGKKQTDSPGLAGVIQPDREGVEPRPSAAPPFPGNRAPSTEHRAQASRDDLASLNGDPVADARWWAPVTEEGWREVEARMLRNVRVRDDFVQIPLPRLADMSGKQIAAAVQQYRREAAIVDARLSRNVTAQQKAAALSDVCDHLRETSGVRLAAGSSVADEKVTLFCKGVPLRDVMRQLSRPFGYTWIRSGAAGEYRYELVQDLRSQLLEEELRNRDRTESLLALERDLQRYRPYLGLTPDEALAQSRTATGPQKALLETLAGPAWAGIQIYFRLSAQELAALRAGQEVTYSGAPRPGERSMPSEVARGILQTMRDRRLVLDSGRYVYTPDNTAPGAIPPAALPEASGRVHLRMLQKEVGQFALNAQVYYFTLVNGEIGYTGGAGRTCGSGVSSTTFKPNNGQVNASLATDPALRRPATLSLAVGSKGARKVDTADVLEAIHLASGSPVVGDYYTRLYAAETLSTRNMPLFEALNRLADATRLRWRREGAWLQFRTTNYYDERVKEVPNRLLARWAEARRRHGALTLEELVEIAQLPDAQLDAESMAEGARERWKLAEWDVARQALTRPHLRFLAGFGPAQRQEAMSATGLLFSKMSLAQQQRYLALGLTGGPLESLADLDGATLRVDYTQPGWFQWGESGWSGRYTRWVIPLELSPRGRRVPRPPVRERTREATLQAVRRVDPELRKALLAAVCRGDSRLPVSPHVVEEDQIVPTKLDLAFVYIPGSTNARDLWEYHPGVNGQCGLGWPQ
jgi:hypothetical protein